MNQAIEYFEECDNRDGTQNSTYFIAKIYLLMDWVDTSEEICKNLSEDIKDPRYSLIRAQIIVK